MNDVVNKNMHKEAIKVEHSKLERAHGSPYRSKCTECHAGVLMVTREQKPPYLLLDFDRCLLCGQLYQYVDILTMRKNEGNE